MEEVKKQKLASFEYEKEIETFVSNDGEELPVKVYEGEVKNNEGQEVVFLRLHFYKFPIKCIKLDQITVRPDFENQKVASQVIDYLKRVSDKFAIPIILNNQIEMFENHMKNHPGTFELYKKRNFETFSPNNQKWLVYPKGKLSEEDLSKLERLIY